MFMTCGADDDTDIRIEELMMIHISRLRGDDDTDIRIEALMMIQISGFKN